ncbi:enoyl-CoA hydratase/isomerase family protein [Zhihengliuella salsuginis]|uniref:Crotonase n=1 Tax=Zhihengliuella salsuginis TaxID=578222 RepID=A0ABQ3GJU1_9MICC|nr:enoyl-CoA hydratase-related protein [Zhihengliuella salsuginis]GHD11161.1 crotonase [Zhihengliuella salsuginis]
MTLDDVDEAADYETILVTQYGPALVVTVNRPRALNALARQVVAELLDLTNRLAETLPSADEAEPGEWACRGVIVTGTGEKAFVAGADIREMSGMTPEQAEAYARDMHQVTLNLEALPVPVIAAVNGFALGGGCELAMACDFIYASANAGFGQPEVSLGLVPGFGGSVRLQQRVGVGIARELIMTGRRIDADEALRIGLVNRVFDDQAALLEAARATVGEVAGQAPTAVANAKATLNAVAHRSVADGLEIEAASFRTAFTTEDSRVGRDAFLAKESASFPGR